MRTVTSILVNVEAAFPDIKGKGVQRNANTDIMVETASVFVTQTVTSEVAVTRFQENALDTVNQGGLEKCVIRNANRVFTVQTVPMAVMQTVTSQVYVTRFRENVPEAVDQDGLETCVIWRVLPDSLDQTAQIDVTHIVVETNPVIQLWGYVLKVV